MRVVVAAGVVAATMAAAATALNKWYPEWRPMPQGQIARVEVQSTPLPLEAPKAPARQAKSITAPAVEQNRQANGQPMPIPKTQGGLADTKSGTNPSVANAEPKRTDQSADGMDKTNGSGSDRDTALTTADAAATAVTVTKVAQSVPAVAKTLVPEGNSAPEEDRLASAQAQGDGQTGAAASGQRRQLMGIPKLNAGGFGETTPVAAEAQLQPVAAPIVPVSKESVAAAIKVAAATPDPHRPIAGQLSVMRIDYDSEGRVVLRGSAEPNSPVRVSLSGEALGVVTSNAEGQWQLIPQKRINVGRYTLQAEALGAANTAISSVELPFEQAKNLQDLPNEDRWVVQPGNNLWRLSKSFYGAGVLYTVIFDANRDIIDDPDLIYPGQIFRIPSVETAELHAGQR